MKSKPIVSVIIPAFNVEEYIEKAIYSALAQTITQLEVIVVDDGSTDNTIIKVQGIDDNRIRWFRQAKNKGPSSSRNYAIDRAQGEWIAILDADDWWEPNRLEELLRVAAAQNADIVCDDLYLVKDGAESPWNTYFRSRERVIGPINSVCVVTPERMVLDDFGFLQPVVRMDFVIRNGIRYKEHRVFGEDFVFFLDCLIHGAKMIICPQAFYYYRWVRTGSLTSTSLANNEGHYGLVHELITSKPYNQIPEVLDALQVKLSGICLEMQKDRVKQMFSSRKFLLGMSLVLQHPALLISFTRDFKQWIVSLSGVV